MGAFCVPFYATRGAGAAAVRWLYSRCCTPPAIPRRGAVQLVSHSLLFSFPQKVRSQPDGQSPSPRSPAVVPGAGAAGGAAGGATGGATGSAAGGAAGGRAIPVEQQALLAGGSVLHCAALLGAVRLLAWAVQDPSLSPLLQLKDGRGLTPLALAASAQVCPLAVPTSPWPRGWTALLPKERGCRAGTSAMTASMGRKPLRGAVTTTTDTHPSHSSSLPLLSSSPGLRLWQADLLRPLFGPQPLERGGTGGQYSGDSVLERARRLDAVISVLRQAAREGDPLPALASGLALALAHGSPALATPDGDGPSPSSAGAAVSSFASAADVTQHLVLYKLVALYESKVRHICMYTAHLFPHFSWAAPSAPLPFLRGTRSRRASPPPPALLICPGEQMDASEHLGLRLVL